MDYSPGMSESKTSSPARGAMLVVGAIVLWAVLQNLLLPLLGVST